MIRTKHKHLLQSRGERVFNFSMNFAGTLISLLVLYPIYYTFIASISKPFFVENGTVMFWPVELTFESYRKALNHMVKTTNKVKNFLHSKRFFDSA